MNCRKDENYQTGKKKRDREKKNILYEIGKQSAPGQDERRDVRKKE